MDEETSAEEVKQGNDAMAPDLRQTLMKFDPVFLDLRHTSLNALLKGTLESGNLPILGRNGDTRTLDLSQSGPDNQDNVDSSDEFSIIDRSTPTTVVVADTDDVSGT